MNQGIPREQCQERCPAGTMVERGGAREVPVRAGASLAPPPPGASLTAGTFRCPACRRPQSWRVVDRLLEWDGRPYVPLAGFRLGLERLPGVTAANLWIDRDHRARGLTELEYFRQLDRITREITAAGGTYILLVAYPGPADHDAARLMDSTEVARITRTWRQMAPFVSKDGLRALLLYNEINVEWRWSPRYGPEDYGQALGALARQAQATFGEVPVLYKSIGTGGGFQHVLAGAARASGLGFDVFPRACSAAEFDPVWEVSLRTLAASRAALGPGLLWATEWGKGSWQEAPPGLYWKAWPPFPSKSELQCVVSRLIREGFTGFIYNGPDQPEYDQSYRWYGELEQWIIQTTLSAPR